MYLFLNATFLHGFWPDHSIVPGGWSIACLVIFYALFPFIIKNFQDRRTYYLFFAFSIWILNTFWFQNFLINSLEKYNLNSNPDSVGTFIYINFINQAPIFILGCYLYFLLKVRPTIYEIFLFLLWMSFSGILNWIYEIPNTGFLIIYILLGFFTYFSIILNLRFKILEIIGKHSYLIYLTHFSVLKFLKKFIFVQFGLVKFFMGFTLTILISYLIASFLSRNLESLIQKNVNSIISKKNKINKSINL